jgi:hypothetical protein
VSFSEPFFSQALFDHFGRFHLARPSLISAVMVALAIASHCIEVEVEAACVVLDHHDHFRGASSPVDCVCSLDHQVDSAIVIAPFGIADLYVLIRKRPDEDGNWGDLVIKRGLKRRARKRVLKINAAAKEVFERLVTESNCRHVFSQPRHPDKKLEPWVLESQMGRLRDKIMVDADAGLHTLRHTFLTEAGEYTDAFTLQYIAGHDTIKTTMRYVHPRAESVSRAFGRINRKKKPARSA